MTVYGPKLVFFLEIYWQLSEELRGKKTATMRLLSCLVVVMLLASEHADSGQKAKPDKKNDTAAKAGRYLFYLPLATRSITIMVMPLAEELAARGHEIVMVMPVELKAKHKNIHIISFEDPFAGMQRPAGTTARQHSTKAPIYTYICTCIYNSSQLCSWKCPNISFKEGPATTTS